MTETDGRTHIEGSGRFRFMKITVNGEAREVINGLSIEALLRELGVTLRFTAVALNREVTPRSAWATTALREGDRVEIVRPMGGGR